MKIAYKLVIVIMLAGGIVLLGGVSSLLDAYPEKAKEDADKEEEAPPEEPKPYGPPGDPPQPEKGLKYYQNIKYGIVVNIPREWPVYINSKVGGVFTTEDADGKRGTIDEGILQFSIEEHQDIIGWIRIGGTHDGDLKEGTRNREPAEWFEGQLKQWNDNYENFTIKPRKASGGALKLGGLSFSYCEMKGTRKGEGAAPAFTRFIFLKRGQATFIIWEVLYAAALEEGKVKFRLRGKPVTVGVHDLLFKYVLCGKGIVTFPKKMPRKPPGR